MYVVDLYMHGHHPLYSIFTYDLEYLKLFIGCHKSLFKQARMTFDIRRMDRSFYLDYINNEFDAIETPSTYISENDFMIQDIELGDDHVVISAPILIKELSARLVRQLDDYRELLLEEMANVEECEELQCLVDLVKHTYDEFIICTDADKEPELLYPYDSANAYRSSWDSNYLAISETGYVEQGFAAVEKYFRDHCGKSFIKHYEDLFVKCFFDWEIPWNI